MSSRPIKLVVAVCYTNSSYVPNAVKSVTDGFVRCTDIVVADYGPPLPTSLRKKDNVSIVRTPKYGYLSSFYAAVEKHGTGPDVHYILIDGSTIYMPHLISEFLNIAPQMDKIIAEKINGASKLNGIIYGLAGIIFSDNKQQALEDELSSLLGETDAAPSSGFSCTTPNISQENSTVDLLDFMGSVYIRGPFLEGIKDEIFATVKSYQAAEAAVLLANWLASKDVLRVQVCTLTNNRFIMERIKSFERVSYSPTAYESTLKDLHIKKCLHLCKLSGPKGT
jgi:hypothetical protein